MFHDQKQSLPKATRAATEDSTFHPLPALFKVIELSPFKKVGGLILLYLLFLHQ
jgi:DNA repair protein RAD5